MLQRLLNKIGSLPLTVESWIVSAVGIIFVRIFLEHYSSNEAGRFVLIDASTIVHYVTFFIAVLLFSTFILMVFSRKSLKESSVIALFGFIIIWYPPILDLTVSKGSGYIMHYLFIPAEDLMKAFVTLFWSTTSNGITYGIRTEIVIVTIATFTVIYSYSKKIGKSFLAAFIMYSGIFILVSIPSILGLFQEGSISRFMESSLLESGIINNSIYPTDLSYERILDIGFNSLMTQLNLTVVLIMGFLICLVGYREKLMTLLKNSRPERILHYSLLILIGILFGGGPSFFDSWVNVFSGAMLVISFVFAWIVAVCINDIYDKGIDEISNQNRPLPQGLFSSAEFYSISIVFTIVSFIASYASSMYGLFFVLAFSFAYYIYSVEPLRLKRNYITGALVIGFASSVAVLAGFFLSNPNKEFLNFHPLLTLFLVILFGFGSMVRDIKDYEGDKKEGINTLPVVIGLVKAKIIIATIIMAGMIWLAWYFKEIPLMVAAVLASVFIWKIFFAKVYKEKDFFIAYLLFLIVFIITFLIK